jgi:hypothetical protein
MPALNARRLREESTAAPARPGLRLATDVDTAAESEVAALQKFIEAEFADTDIGPKPWPRSVSVPLIFLVSTGLWYAIFVGARAALRL